MSIRVRCVALLRCSGLVLLHRDRQDDFWALPGGAVEPGERAAPALLRELQEELGWNCPDPKLKAVHEQTFTWREREHHEMALCFEVTPCAAARESAERGGEFDAREPHLIFRWQPVGEISALDLRPEALRPVVSDMSARVFHLY